MTEIPAAGYFGDVTRTVAEAKQAQDDVLAVLRELPGGAARETLTIASGLVTPTRAFVRVDTEGGAASDDLTNIDQTNTRDGATLCLTIDSSTRPVTVRHGAGGAGQILLARSADFTIADTGTHVSLLRVGSTWVEVGRSYGADAEAQNLSVLGTLDVAGATVHHDGNAKRIHQIVTGTDPAIYSINTTIADRGAYFVVTPTTPTSKLLVIASSAMRVNDVSVAAEANMRLGYHDGSWHDVGQWSRVLTMAGGNGSNDIRIEVTVPLIFLFHPAHRGVGGEWTIVRMASYTGDDESGNISNFYYTAIELEV